MKLKFSIFIYFYHILKLIKKYALKLSVIDNITR